jgi:hypothetical protein
MLHTLGDNSETCYAAKTQGKGKKLICMSLRRSPKVEENKTEIEPRKQTNNGNRQRDEER